MTMFRTFRTMLEVGRPTISEPSWKPGRSGQLASRALRHSSFLVGGGVLAIMTVLAVLAPLIAPYDPYEQNLGVRLIGPIWAEAGNWHHPLGTDEFGRDYLSRLLHGASTSMSIGLMVTFLAGLIGTTLGVLAGYFGGRIDAVIMLLINVRLAMPGILIALAVVSLTGSSTAIVVILLGLLLWDRFAVVMRSATQQVRNLDYLRAAQALGCSRTRIILGEVLPNVMNALIVITTLEFAHAILSEAALSFLGLGVPAPTPSWGAMVSDGKRHLLFEPWLTWLPGACLFVLVMAVNLVGDAVRDILTPEGRA